MSAPEQIEAGKFTVNEKVYVPHTDKFYEAKILKTEYRGQSGWFYFLHYNGWNKKYDEWVEEGGLVKAEVAEASGAAVPAPGKAKKGGPGAHAAAGVFGAKAAAAGALGSSKASKASAVGALGSPMGGGGYAAAGSGLGLDVDLPAALKKVLLDDFECVFEESRFVPLPRQPTIIELLQQYVAEAKETRGTTLVDAEEEVANGLQSYFDKSLLVALLYRNERGQAAEALADGRMPSAVYGAEHLVRLLYKLPELMPLAALTDDQLSTIATMVQDVMMWLVEHHSTLFLTKDQYLPSTLPQPQQQGAAG